MTFVTPEKKKVTIEDWFLTSGILILLTMIAGLVWNWKALPPQLPWQYSLPWGDSQLISKEVFAGLLGGMTILFSLTKILSGWVGGKDETVRILILAGGLIATMLYAAGFWTVLNIFIGQ